MLCVDALRSWCNKQAAERGLEMANLTSSWQSGELFEMLTRLYNNIEILTRLYNNNIEMKLTRLFQSGCKARGTTTNRVTRYSESITKCSFLMKEMD